MKRYWKILSICLVTILVIGTFYVQSSLATANHGKIDFEKVSGDEDELQNIMLNANFLPDHSNLYQRLQITSEETIDSTILSFPQKISRLGVPYYLEDLVERHKDFMRSKDFNPNHFFEDENAVAYAHIKNSSKQDLNFDIEMLTKKSEEITSLKVEVPEKENYGWMQVIDVQEIDGKLKVITQSFHLGSKQHELRVYTFDIKEQKLVSEDLITSIPGVEDGWSDLRIINDTYSIQRQKYLLIKAEAFVNEEVYSDGEPNAVVNETIVYDIENNQSIKMMASDEMLGLMGDSPAIHDSTLFIPSETANGVEVHQYDIENDKWGEILSFDLADKKDGEDGAYTKIMNGKLYTIYATNHGHTIGISDLQTGESLYEGKLKVTNEGKVQKDYQLYIYEIEYVQ